MRANSRVPTSAQAGVHEHLVRLLERHRLAPFRKPYADYNRVAFETSFARREREAPDAPLILDACCGVGESSVALARAFPEHYVIGVDQSEARLGRFELARLPPNLDLVRADLVDARCWRPPGAALPALSQPLAEDRAPLAALARTSGISSHARTRRRARMPQQLAYLCR